MICIILAAGYATRLYPLTKNFPKPLLQVNGKTVLDWVIDDLDERITSYVVISNHKYSKSFSDWAGFKDKKIVVLDDGTTTNETRLGAVKDLELAIDTLNISSDCLVLAGDNLFDYSLNKFLDYSKDKKTSCVARYELLNNEEMKKHGGVIVDNNDIVIDMFEKSPNPKSNWCCPTLYYLLKKDIKLIKKAIKDGIKTDAPGDFISWLIRNNIKMHAYNIPGNVYDIGNLESYEKIKKEYKGYKNK